MICKKLILRPKSHRISHHWLKIQLDKHLNFKRYNCNRLLSRGLTPSLSQILELEPTSTMQITRTESATPVKSHTMRYNQNTLNSPLHPIKYTMHPASLPLPNPIPNQNKTQTTCKTKGIKDSRTKKVDDYTAPATNITLKRVTNAANKKKKKKQKTT